MKIKKYIYIAAAAILSSCQSEEIIRYVYSVGEADNTIQLMAGISDGHSGVMTRAGAEDHHASHLPFTANTQVRLRVDGTWTGHSPVVITKTTTATIGAETSTDSKHNTVTFTDAEKLYWDDYGTADPANASTGRATGLTIYGVAVDGETTAPSVSDWTSLSWELATNQTSGWAAKDLLTSNNVKVGGPDGTYKFDERSFGKLLEFTHAMTKITVNLTAGEGFPGWSSSSTDGGKFQTVPTVKLLGFNYTGTVNVETKTSTPTTTTTADINAYRDNGTAWVSGGQHTSQFTALVFPGNQFTATIADDANKTPTSSTDILELNADGNVLKVTAAQLVKAIAGTSTTGTSVNGTLEQGKNYILNITVNKTDIEVTATIKDWVDVPTEEALPKINVTATYGYTAGTVDHTTTFAKNYDLFRSTVKATGYDEDNKTDGINPAARYTSSSSSWDKTIYWPDHQTHYFFRGVYPQIGTAVSGTSTITSQEAVTTTNGNDVVAVANATYTPETYPSDLAIAIPRGTTDGTLDETCKVTGHNSTPGICATEGVINLNFEYAMSKVEIRLKSSNTDAGHIAMTKDNTKVEIIGGYSKARIKLSDGLHDDYADADKVDYKLSNLESAETGFLVTTRDAIVPQEIANAVIFRITVTTGDNDTPDDASDDPTDVYECQVNKINVKNYNPASPVTEWVHGKHYIYELDLNKTEIKVTATITDWVTVNASEDVWF